MNLPNLKDLEKIIALCRKRGVKEIEIDNVKMTFSDEVPLSPYKKKQTETANESFLNETQLTEEQLLMYSVQNMGSGTEEGH